MGCATTPPLSGGIGRRSALQDFMGHGKPPHSRLAWLHRRNALEEKTLSVRNSTFPELERQGRSASYAGCEGKLSERPAGR